MIAIISILASMLLPALQNARQMARRSVCAGNLRGVGIAMQLYLDDHDGWFPHYELGAGVFADYTDVTYDTENGPYCPSKEFARPPTLGGARYFTYGYNYSYLGDYTSSNTTLRRLPDINQPALVLAYADNAQSGKEIDEWFYPLIRYWTAASGHEYPIGIRHGGGANAVCIDTHVEWHLRAWWDAEPNRHRWRE